MASDDNSAGDGKNAALSFTAGADGLYTVEVLAVDGGGDYRLTVTIPGNRAPVATDNTALTSEDAPVTTGDVLADIVSYVWQENGRTLATGASPAVPLLIGTHALMVIVTDSAGVTSQDIVEIVANAALGSPPFVLTGPEVVEVGQGNGSVTTTWENQLPGSTLDLYIFGPVGWQLAAAAVACTAGQTTVSTSLLPAGWYRLAGQATGAGGAGGMAFAPGQHVHIAPSPPAPASAPAQPATAAIQFLTPGENQAVRVGQVFEIRWSVLVPDSAPEALTLRVRPADGGDWLTIAPFVPTAQAAYLWDTAAVSAGRYVLSALWQSDGAWQEALAANPLDIQLS